MGGSGVIPFLDGPKLHHFPTPPGKELKPNSLSVIATKFKITPCKLVFELFFSAIHQFDLINRLKVLISGGSKRGSKKRSPRRKKHVSGGGTISDDSTVPGMPRYSTRVPENVRIPKPPKSPSLRSSLVASKRGTPRTR